jgi:hypothetical protein
VYNLIYELGLGEGLGRRRGGEDGIEVLKLNFTVHEDLGALGRGEDGFEDIVRPVSLQHEEGELREERASIRAWSAWYHEMRCGSNMPSAT